MNRNYQKYINSRDIETLDFGTCGVSRPILPFLFPQKLVNWKLPLRMYERGLIAMGDSWCDSHRKLFAPFYVRGLVNSGVRTLYITDSQLAQSTEGCPEGKAEDKFIGTLKVNDYEVHEALLSEDFDPQIFDRGTRVSILHSERSEVASKENSSAYQANLIRTLRELAASNITSHRSRRKNGDLVVVIEENLYGYIAKGSELEEVLCWLRGRGIGIVISCNDTRGMRGVVNSFGHYLFFRMDDSIEEIDACDLFCRARMDQASTGHIKMGFMLTSKDLRHLGDEQCYYLARNSHDENIIHCFGTFEATGK